MDNQATETTPVEHTAYWQDRGWIFRKSHGRPCYDGHYRVFDQKTDQPRQFPGRIIVYKRKSQDGSTECLEYWTYIAQLPPEITSHPKHGCMKHIGNGWFQIHWDRGPYHPDVAILAIEKILDEAINPRPAEREL